MKLIFALAVLLALATAAQAETKFYKGSGPTKTEITKGEAILTLAQSKNKDSVVKCTDVELDMRKGTIRNR